MEAFTEVDLAKAVIRNLAEHKWEIYQEVELRSGGLRADIVAVQDKRVWIIETKRSLGPTVIVGARQWLT